MRKRLLGRDQLRGLADATGVALRGGGLRAAAEAQGVGFRVGSLHRDGGAEPRCWSMIAEPKKNGWAAPHLAPGLDPHGLVPWVNQMES